MKAKHKATELETVQELAPAVRHFERGEVLANLPADFDYPFLNPNSPDAEQKQEVVKAALAEYVRTVIDPDNVTRPKITVVDTVPVYGGRFTTDRAVFFSLTTTKGGELRLVDSDKKHQNVKLSRGTFVAVEGFTKWFLNMAYSPARIVLVIEY